MSHDLPGPSNITVWHLFNAGTYNPSTQGAIASINYSEDRIVVSPPFAGSAIGGGFLLQQGGVTYGIGGLNFTSLSWTTLEFERQREWYVYNHQRPRQLAGHDQSGGASAPCRLAPQHGLSQPPRPTLDKVGSGSATHSRGESVVSLRSETARPGFHRTRTLAHYWRAPVAPSTLRLIQSSINTVVSGAFRCRPASWLVWSSMTIS